MRWQNWAAVLGASLLLHVVVFWPLPDMQLNGFSRPVLLARIVPVEVPFAREDPPVLEDTRDHSSLQRADAGVVQMDKRGDRGLRAASRGQEIERASPKNRYEAEIANANQSSGGLANLPVPTELPSGTNVSPSEQGSLARYRLALAAAAIRMQSAVKPDVGRHSGTVVLEVSRFGESATPRVTLSQSSGVELLDAEAVALLSRAVELVPLSVLGPISNVSLRLPVVFEATEP